MAENMAELKREVLLKFFDEEFAPTVAACPGCLYNCYIMEEGYHSRRLRNFLFLLLEIPTIIQMVRITSKRKKSPVR